MNVSTINKRGGNGLGWYGYAYAYDLLHGNGKLDSTELVMKVLTASERHRGAFWIFFNDLGYTPTAGFLELFWLGSLGLDIFLKKRKKDTTKSVSRATRLSRF